ncbi:integrator complex subunit 11 [Dendrobium catenatum]|uniref:Integrator complex subunit 11 n=1 Tax=Dendrobium catenatum TaxID=906689 RepID=A0A2I0VYD0_9ASPA|nr:integrator complex subunit 11 [Dendrobium catenatum]
MGEGGVVFDKEQDIFVSGVDYFKHIFNKDTITTPITNPFIVPKCISDTDNEMLIKPPSEEEVWNTVKDMINDSTADPDGFTTKFFVHSWNIIKFDVLEAVKDFFNGSPYPKFFSAILVDILPRIISINQTHFVKGRSIFDNILLVQEMTLDINSKVKGGNIIYKLDISKAYDNLNLNFLYKMLSLFGFSQVFYPVE